MEGAKSKFLDLKTLCTIRIGRRHKIYPIRNVGQVLDLRYVIHGEIARLTQSSAGL